MAAGVERLYGQKNAIPTVAKRQAGARGAAEGGVEGKLAAQESANARADGERD